VRSSDLPPLPPHVSPRELLNQFVQDVHGKEVQIAATYSYMWLADQVGHICVGIVFTFLFNFIIIVFLLYCYGWIGDWGHHLIAFGLTSAVAAGWEYRSYKCAVRNCVGPFPPDRTLLAKNAATAAIYIVLGAGIGWVILDADSATTIAPAMWTAAKCIALLLLAALLVPFWLRQKIIWQKAGLPYLARLADAEFGISRELSSQLLHLIESGGAQLQERWVVVIGGPIGSGRTSLASAIGTEFAFRGRRVRYLRFGDLVEFDISGDYEDAPPPPGPRNIQYWPWSTAEVLIIDDLGPTLAAAGLMSAQRTHEAFRAWLTQHLNGIARAVGNRNTIWIVDEDTEETHVRFRESAAVIQDVIKGMKLLPIQLSMRL
jgi:IstB-like ATP binding protein